MANIRLLIAYRLLHGKDRCEGERLELEEWLAASEENRRLYQRLMNRQQWTAWKAERDTVNADIYWKAVERRTIGQRRTKMRRRLLAVAASVMLLLSVGMFYIFHSREAEVTKEMAMVILPGSSKAQLVFSDGKTVVLDSRLSPDRKIEKDGALIIADSTGLNYMTNETEEASHTHHTLLVPKGGEYILRLEEGTVVHLNSQSVLEYPVHFAKNKREVYLEGEAFFRVEHTDDIPFIVHTRSMDIHVTGTEFNVRAYGSESKVQTTLSKGRVNVVVNENQYELFPDQQAELDLSSMMTKVRQVDSEDYIAWKNGWFVFRNQRLEDIMNELARWYDFEVFYQNPEVCNMIFGGKLNREGSIEPILKVMEATLTLQISIKGKTIVFQSK